MKNSDRFWQTVLTRYCWDTPHPRPAFTLRVKVGDIWIFSENSKRYNLAHLASVSFQTNSPGNRQARGLCISLNRYKYPYMKLCYRHRRTVLANCTGNLNESYIASIHDWDLFTSTQYTRVDSRDSTDHHWLAHHIAL